MDDLEARLRAELDRRAGLVDGSAVVPPDVRRRVRRQRLVRGAGVAGVLALVLTGGGFTLWTFTGRDARTVVTDVADDQTGLVPPSEDEPSDPDLPTSVETQDQATSTEDQAPTSATTTGETTNTTTSTAPPSPGQTGSPGGGDPSGPAPTTVEEAVACRGGDPLDQGPGVGMADLDGDGAPDSVRVGLTLDITTSGGRPSSVELSSARGAYLLGTADADGDGRDEVFIDLDRGGSQFLSPDLPNGTDIVLARLVGCDVVLVKNAQGEPFRFAVGHNEETGRSLGVGCIDTDGDARLDLVGLQGERRDNVIMWKRTQVWLEGERAFPGSVTTGTYEADDPQVAQLGTASCGDDSFADVP